MSSHSAHGRLIGLATLDLSVRSRVPSPLAHTFLYKHLLQEWMATATIHMTITWYNILIHFNLAELAWPAGLEYFCQEQFLVYFCLFLLSISTDFISFPSNLIQWTSWGYEGSTRALKALPWNFGAVMPSPGALEAQPEAEEIHSGAVNAHLGAVQAHRTNFTVN
jgi:hypothetical protein